MTSLLALPDSAPRTVAVLPLLAMEIMAAAVLP
jgi:hypothetical protein